MQQVIVSTGESKHAFAELEGKFAQRQRDLAILSEQINPVRRRLGVGQTLGQAEETYRLRSGWRTTQSSVRAKDQGV